jgi:chromosome segregation protein
VAKLHIEAGWETALEAVLRERMSAQMSTWTGPRPSSAMPPAGQAGAVRNAGWPPEAQPVAGLKPFWASAADERSGPAP